MDSTTTAATATATAKTHKVQKPIFLATHPRSCSTAFERVMMTRSDDALVCIHEPFGDAFYYGPERMGERYFGDEGKEARIKSGLENITFGDVVASIEEQRVQAEKENKRIFIKDITHYLLPPNPLEKPAHIMPSLRLGIQKRKGYGTNGTNATVNGHANGMNGDFSDHKQNGYNEVTNVFETKETGGDEDGEDEDLNNPTVLPLRILRNYQFTFLIRHPRRAIPSYYRCCIPPLSNDTGFDHFMPSEAGYRELREFFQYLCAKGLVSLESLCVIDADDLLDKPKEIMQRYCESVGLDFKESMLEWEVGGECCEKFEKWKGFHNDAIGSVGLRPREHAKKQEKSEEEEYKSWAEMYGEEGADLIRETVRENLKDYEYLKQFKVTV